MSKQKKQAQDLPEKETAETGTEEVAQLAAEPENVQTPNAEAEQSTVAEEETAIESELVRQRDLVKELEDRNLRLNAEFDNFRKRSRKEKEEAYTYAKLDLVKEFFPLLDALDRAEEQYSKMEGEAQKQMLEGICLLKKQGVECLERLGVSEIKCVGEQFDPQIHEAIQHIEDEAYGENEVIDCLLKGYRAGKEIIRHSVVRVAN